MEGAAADARRPSGGCGSDDELTAEAAADTTDGGAEGLVSPSSPEPDMLAEIRTKVFVPPKTVRELPPPFSSLSAAILGLKLYTIIDYIMDSA